VAVGARSGLRSGTAAATIGVLKTPPGLRNKIQRRGRTTWGELREPGESAVLMVDGGKSRPQWRSVWEIAAAATCVSKTSTLYI
jgi:hypothetical protein